MQLREELKNCRSRIQLPKSETVRKFIIHIFKSLQINSHQAKSVCIQALVLIERIICASQQFCHSSFKHSSQEDIFDILLSVMPKVDENLLSESSTETLFTKSDMVVLDATNKLMKMRPVRPLFQVTAYNWKPILFTSLVLSIKYQEDLMIKNVMVFNAVKMFSVSEINRWLKLFTVLLDFRIDVGISEYNSYFKWLIVYSKIKENHHEEED